MQQLRADNVQLSDQLLERKKEQSRLLAEVDALKTAKADAVQRQTDLQYELQIVAADLQKLQTRMVTSPEELQQSVDALQTQVQAERAALGDAERKARELSAKVDVLASLDQDLDAAIGALEQVHHAVDRAAREARALDEAQSALVTLTDDAAAQAHRNEQHERQVAAAVERLERARAELEAKRAERHAALQALTAQLGDVSARRKERHEQAEAAHHEASEWEKRLASVLQEHDAHCARLQREKDALCRTAAAYMGALAQAMAPSIGQD